jgi:hypothetical protein
MKTAKLSFDFSDSPELVEMLRVFATKKGTTQKAVVSEALKAFFADQLESSLLLRAADLAFQEWDNEDDKVYDSI